jgi:LacI family transcriptional regulator
MGPLARGRTAKVAMIAGSLSYRAHEEREAGFLHLFEEQCPGVHVVGAREGHDDAEKNYRQARALFEQHADLAGIYNIGGGAEGMAAPSTRRGWRASRSSSATASRPTRARC